MNAAPRPATIADAPAIARLRVDGWRTAYRGLVPDAYLDAMQVDASVAMWERVLGADAPLASVFVVAEDGALAGFASGHRLAEPRLGFDTELSAVYVRADRQRRGLGHALVGAVVDAQRARGATGLIVWTLAGSKPARAFYERLGARLLIEQPFQWDGMDLIEAGFGFDDLAALSERCRVAGIPAANLLH